MAKNAGANYLCFTKINSVKGLSGKQIKAELYDLNTMSYVPNKIGMKTIKDDFSDLVHLTGIILDVVADMLGTGKGNSSSSASLSHSNNANNTSGNTLTDSRDGRQYKTVKIGSLVWMAENLNYKMGNSWCYKNDDFNCSKYGRLYDWNTAKNVCTNGWHLPSQGEWNDLIQTASGTNIAGKKLKSKNFWKDNSNEGTDDFSFSALPGGRLIDGNFEGIDEYGNWWTASEDSSNAYLKFMGSNVDYVGENKRSKSRGYSVRCVKSSNSNSSANSEEEQQGLFGLALLEARRKEELKNAQKPKEATVKGYLKSSRSKEELMKVVNANKPKLKDIYYTYRLISYENFGISSFGGKITLKFTIAPSGNITSISIVSSTTNNRDFDNVFKDEVARQKWEALIRGFDNSIKDEVAKWKWEAISGEAASYTLPLSFPDD